MAALRAPRRDDESGEDQAQGTVSPWAVAAIGQPGEVVDVDQVDEAAPQSAEFMVHAPASADRSAAERASWAPSVQGAAFTWVSAHGGAGSTSLARSSGLGVDLSCRWPDPRLGWPAAVAVVCRSDAAGLTAAAGMLAAAASGGVPDLNVAALVVVDDAPVKVSKVIKARIHELGGTVPELIRVPWIRAWRDNPYTPDKSATKAAATVAAAVNNMREYR
jgi:hypothetical protein